MEILANTLPAGNDLAMIETIHRFNGRMQDRIQ